MYPELVWKKKGRGGLDFVGLSNNMKGECSSILSSNDDSCGGTKFLGETLGGGVRSG